MKICFISNYNVGLGLSGGDRIFIELLKGWRDKADLTLMGCGEALAIAERNGVAGVRLLETSAVDGSASYGLLALLRHTLRRWRSGLRGLKRYAAELSEIDVVYSVSDFYPDFWPAYRLKRRRAGITWIAGYYLFAPPPWAKDSPYKGRDFLRGLIYWLLQRPSYWLVRRHADVVFVTSEPDVARFVTRRRGRDRIVVVQGGVDIAASEAHLTSGAALPLAQRRYDACFMGRLHYQKGALILPDIWKFVCARRPQARLALIGDGHLEREVRAKIASLGLEDNIEMLGFRDGPAKHEIFKQAKMMLHPSTYDSGGMAAAEGLAWCLPGVSFDLEALKTYYPQGMVKVPPGDLQAFADAVLRLLGDPAHHERTAAAAHALILDVWDWRKRSARVFAAVVKAMAGAEP